MWQRFVTITLKEGRDMQHTFQAWDLEFLHQA
jgi:hypothetical protein